MGETKNINDAYFNWLSLDSTLEEFSEEVSSVIERENNDWILSKIDTELRSNMNLMREIAGSTSKEDLEEAKVIIEMITKKLGILRNMIDTYLDNTNLAEEMEKTPGEEVKVVFAKNRSGKIIAERQFEDIKKYGDDKYEDTMSLLDKLYDGDTDFSSEKQKSLTSNARLKGIYELKDYQVRLIYMRESIYTVVIGACVKKDDNDIRYREGVENMKKQSEKYRQAIRAGILDMEEELAIADQFREELTSGLRRGK